jgi:sn-glycerol 3-phosphate transport system ATP-binding protein
MATLDLIGLRKSFGETQVLHEIDLSLADGEMLVIVGASGCGKSTLLRMVAGLERPSAGRIVLEGQDIADRDPAARDIAMVFQNYALYPHMSVFENMAYGLRIRGLKREEIARRVDEAATMLGLQALLRRLPRQLSGGQRQRVAMGRAIVREPKLFLFDEPLSNLDAALRVQMRGEIKRLQRRLGVTSLYVTHDQTEAMTLGDRLLVLHQGRMAQFDTPMAVFAAPADTYVARFIGAPAMNLLPARLARDGTAALLDHGPLLPLDGSRIAQPDGVRLTVGIRPEHLAPAAQGLAGEVDLVERLGSESVVHMRLADGSALTVKLQGADLAAERLIVAPLPGQLHVFDAESGKRMGPEPAAARPSLLEAGETAV